MNCALLMFAVKTKLKFAAANYLAHIKNTLYQKLVLKFTKKVLLYVKPKLILPKILHLIFLILAFITSILILSVAIVDTWLEYNL